MRDDQLKRLEAIQEKMVDALVVEMDPDFWPGAFDDKGDRKNPAELTKDERGDRYWCKKNAAATLTLITKVESLQHFRNRYMTNPAPEETVEDDNADMDKEISRHEKEAERLLSKFQARNGPVGHA